MKRKHILIITGLISAATMMAGCIKHPLETAPEGNYTTENYWRNQSDVLAGVAGIYNILFQEDGAGHGNYIFDDAGDDISVDGDHDDYKSIERFNANSTLYQIRTTWTYSYEQIARANNAIIYIPKVPAMDEGIRTRSMGEAYFLRAYAYWTLNNIYGEVPLIKEENVLNGTYNVPKNSIEDVRNFIASDLQKAADMLPETYSGADRGRVSKGAAWGMLCKLYMTWEKMDSALIYGQKVISDPNYALAANYTDNFMPETQVNNNEILFAIWNLDMYNSSPQSIYFTARAWNGWGFHHPTENFASEFEAADTIRKRATLVSIGDSIPNQQALIEISDKDAYQMFAGQQGQVTGRLLPSQTTTGYCVRKYTAFKADGNMNYSVKQPLLRTADIYLLVAEAKIRISGAGAGDAEINAIRNRAGLQSVHGAGFKDLMHERRVELGAENVRYFDLLRWDKAKLISVDTILNKAKLASPLEPYNSSVVVPERQFTRPKDYYMPIPQSIIDESKGVITQNPNYN